MHGGGGGAAACDTVKVWPATVSVPVRAGPGFTAAANASVPLPVPAAAPVSVNHAALVLAVHAHVAAEAVTATEPEPPLSATSCDAGEIVNVHGGGGAAAACDTVKVCPPMVSVPVRAAAVFAATLNATVPLPVPEAPLVTVNHAALALAVHAQVFADAVTVTDPAAAVSATSCVVGEIPNVHGGGGAAACATVKVFPAAAIVAVR